MVSKPASWFFLTTFLLLGVPINAMFLGKQRLAPPIARRDAGEVTVRWISQNLDHFNAAGTTTWEQKYFMNEQYYASGGPVFLFIGGEAPAEEGWMQGGQMMALAEKFGAMAFQLEHRYYGDSHPTQDTSTPNLWYLRTEQALADLAYFIQAMNDEYQLQDSKWIAFGGSYAGNLAAWLRLKYPHLVHGAVSSSGPLLAQTDFPEYFEVVSDSMNRSSEQCVDDIRNATSEMEQLLQTSTGLEDIATLFNLCSPLDLGRPNDVHVLFMSLANVFASAVQNNKNGDIESVCELVTSLEYGDTPLQRYAALVNNSSECFNLSFDVVLQRYQDVTWDGNTSQRTWLYQTCTEYGYYQTSASENQPFGKGFPLQYYIDMCSTVFGTNFDELRVQKGVERTNLFYGGVEPHLSNVVFVQGAQDPWHPLGVLRNLSHFARAIVIDGAAHCQDMSTATDSDSPQMTAARVQIAALLAEWMNRTYPEGNL